MELGKLEPIGGSVEVFEESVCTRCGKVLKTWECANWGLVPDRWNPGEYAEAAFPNRSLASNYARERAREIVAYRASVCCSNKGED